MYTSSRMDRIRAINELILRMAQPKKRIWFDTLDEPDRQIMSKHWAGKEPLTSQEALRFEELTLHAVYFVWQEIKEDVHNRKR